MDGVQCGISIHEYTMSKVKIEVIGTCISSDMCQFSVLRILKIPSPNRLETYNSTLSIRERVVAQHINIQHPNPIWEHLFKFHSFSLVKPPANTLGRHQEMTKVPGPLPPTWNPRPLASAWSRPACCSHFTVNQRMKLSFR